MLQNYQRHADLKQKQLLKKYLSIKSFVPEAVYSDGTEMFRAPSEPRPYETVRIKIRVYRRNVKTIRLYVDGEPKLMMREDIDRGDMFDYYYADISLTDQPIRYYFELRASGLTYIYDRTGIRDVHERAFDFVITPGFSTPDWAKGAVVYQIYVDRFYNADPTNDVLTGEYAYINEHIRHVDQWERYPASLDVREFYGGDLAGIMAKLDYLKDLGVEAIYLNPIFVSPSNHKYDAQDYDNIDPHFGIIKRRRGKVLDEGDLDNSHATMYKDAVTDPENKMLTDKLFISLVEEIHKRGMRIILDGVFNHCGSFNKWLDREHIYSDADGFPDGAYESENSPYRSFFSFKDENAWPNNDTYDGWWNNDTLPKLNYEGSQELYDYIMGIARKWVSPPYNCDGWRLDVAADLGHSAEFNHKFWRDFRKNVKAANPDAIIIAEHYGDPYEWLLGDQWDTVMNYDAFMEPVTWFFTGMEKHSDYARPDLYNNGRAFADSLIYNMTRFHPSSILVAMNELSNHDHSRFLTRTNRTPGRTQTLGPEAANKDINVAVMREAVVFQFTWPGAPTVYYGDEAGMCGWTDPDNRRTYPWGRENKEMIRFHREMIKIHKSYKALRTGSCKILVVGDGIFSFTRFDEEDKFVITFNNNSTMTEVVIPVWQSGMMESEMLVSLIYTNIDFFALDARQYASMDGFVTYKMPPYSAMVMKSIPTRIISI